MSGEEEKAETTFHDAQRLMSAGRFEEARALLQPPLEQTPDSVDALYMSAVCERYLKRPDKAAALLKTLKTVSPDFGRAFQEEGHLARDAGKRDQALSAYAQAVRANPGLEASWRGQEQILRAMGRDAEAAQAKVQAERLAALPRELLAATNFLHEGKLLKAENLCRRFLQNNPKHVEGMRLLADVGARMGALDDADFLLESAIAFEPDNIQLRHSALAQAPEIRGGA